MAKKRIIVDCMGGDKAPGEMLAGVVAAKRELDGDYLLVGVREQMQEAARERGIDLAGFDILDAEDVINMADDPMCVLHAKKNASMTVALRALRDGQGDAMVSTGNTGALFTGASLIVKRVPGVHRAAIATTLMFEKPFLLLDSGANVTIQPDFLPQFALMGSAYMKGLFGLEFPRVGLVNNGTEACKGTPLQTEGYRLLSATPGIQFVGNVEPSSLPFDVCDVAVTDGFTGNVCLKAFEGVSKFILHGLKDVFMTNPVTKLSALGIKKPLGEFRKKVDTAEYGGSPILGLCKPVIKAHGSSDARAFASAIRQATRLCESGALDGLETALTAATATTDPEA